MNSKLEVIAIETAALFEEALDKAARLLRAGEVVAVPTETVYGLAANAMDPAAVENIFRIKGRPATNPIIVHVASMEMAWRCAGDWPDPAKILAEGFWPGPLTLVVPRAREIPDAVTAGGGTVALRWPLHPFVRELIARCGFPLAAPSANSSGTISPTLAAHVAQDLGSKLRLIVDAGLSQIGVESTVVDTTVWPVRILRPGMVDAGMIERALGNRVAADAPIGSGALRSPGLLSKHYSPNAKLFVESWWDPEELRGILKQIGTEPSATFVLCHDHVRGNEGLGHVSVLPNDAEAYARALYAELHRCDEQGARWIVVERPPDGPAWEAIHDRLRRAAMSST